MAACELWATSIRRQLSNAAATSHPYAQTRTETRRPVHRDVRTISDYCWSGSETAVACVDNMRMQETMLDAGHILCYSLYKRLYKRLYKL